MDFSRDAIYMLEKLNKSGFEAYIVGGAVRDNLLGLPVYDVDITTSAKTDDLKRVFAEFKIIETGVRHGTVTVIYKSVPYEITTFRSDGAYRDNRHPDEVTFISSLEEDLKRRDFTVNAMAWSEKSGVIDLFGGKHDLELGLIRAVGEPEKRFDEDALRILRALRFSAKLGFKIEEKTLAAIDSKLENLKNVSVERVFSELTKTIIAKHAPFALVSYPQIFFAVLPELQPTSSCGQLSRSHCYDVYTHTVKALENLKNVNELLAWAIVFHDAGKPFTVVHGTDGYMHFPDHWVVSSEIAEKALNRLKAPKKFISAVCALSYYHDALFDDKPKIKRFMRKYGIELTKDLIEIKYADLYAHSQYGIEKYSGTVTVFEKLFGEILADNEPYLLKHLAVSGDDIVALGVDKKKTGEKLEEIYELIITLKLDNDKDKILQYIKKND